MWLSLIEEPEVQHLSVLYLSFALLHFSKGPVYVSTYKTQNLILAPYVMQWLIYIGFLGG